MSFWLKSPSAKEDVATATAVLSDVSVVSDFFVLVAMSFCCYVVMLFCLFVSVRIIFLYDPYKINSSA